MTYWTIQGSNVIKLLEHEKVYYPDFTLSPQTHIDTYQTLLRVYNESNFTEYKGLIFCMTKDDAQTFRDVDDFYNYFSERPRIVNALNNGAYSLFDNHHYLLRIKTNRFDLLNPCLVDFWNFIIMTSNDEDVNATLYYNLRELHPSLHKISYEQFVDASWQLMRDQKMIKSLMKSTILQANIPYIDIDMEIERYDLGRLMKG